MRKMWGYAAVLLWSGIALGGGQVRSGGYGVVIDGNLHALDLAIRGVHLDPYVSDGSRAVLSQDLRDILDYHLNRVILPSGLELVAKKLAELDQRSKQLGLNYKVEGMIVNMDRYRWINLSNLSCLNVGDDDTPFPNKVQLAFREGMWVKFCRDFNRLPAVDQAALVLHEIIYALHTTGQPFVSYLTGYLFSHDFRQFLPLAQDEFRNVIAGLTKVPDGAAMTLFKRLQKMYEAGTKPALRDFLKPGVWVGKCVGDLHPDSIGSAALFSFTNTDDILGQMSTFAPQVADYNDERYLGMPTEDLRKLWTTLSSRVNREFGYVRENDFSEQLVLSHDDIRGDRCFSANARTPMSLVLRQTVNSQGEKVLMAAIGLYSGCSISEDRHLMCYYNQRRL